MRLFEFERRWLLAVFDAILPSGTPGGLALGARELPLSGFVSELVRHAPLDVVIGIRFMLWLLVLCPLFVLGRPRTFLGLEREERVALLEKLRESPRYVVREIPLFFKLLACLGHSGHPAVQEELGLEPRDRTPPSWEHAP